MKITKRQLRRIIREEAAKSTKKYDDDSALKGDQDELPDALQKGIIDKSVEDRDEESKKDEAFRVTLSQLRGIVREAVEEMLDAEHPSDVEPQEDVALGGENLYLDIDHVKAYGGEAVVDVPEMLNLVGEGPRGPGAFVVTGKPSPMKSRASKDLARLVRRQRRG